MKPRSSGGMRRTFRREPGSARRPGYGTRRRPPRRRQWSPRLAERARKLLAAWAGNHQVEQANRWKARWRRLSRRADRRGMPRHRCRYRAWFRRRSGRSCHAPSLYRTTRVEFENASYTCGRFAPRSVASNSSPAPMLRPLCSCKYCATSLDRDFGILAQAARPLQDLEYARL